MKEQLLETWQIHNRINLYLLDAIEKEEYLMDPSTAKGHNVGNQFTHIHNVRLMWLKIALPELLKGFQKIEKAEAISKSFLQENLKASSIAIEKLLEHGLSNNKIKGFKPHPVSFLGLLISHESHHRGQIVLSLKQSGHPISRKAGFGLWQWGTR